MEGGAGHDVFFASLRGRDVDSWIDGGSGADVLYTSDLSRVDSRFKMNVEHSAPTFLDYYFATEGKRFASGGEDKTIIIWTHKAEGILKYNHNVAPQVE